MAIKPWSRFKYEIVSWKDLAGFEDAQTSPVIPHASNADSVFDWCDWGDF